jgi:hypothetical protein
MQYLQKRGVPRNIPQPAQLDLFSWRPTPTLGFAPIAAQRLASRFGLTIHHAIIVARLAGLGSEARQ